MIIIFYFDDEKMIKIIWWNFYDVLKILGFIYKWGLFLFVILGKIYVLIKVKIFYFIRVVFYNINFKWKIFVCLFELLWLWFDDWSF